MPQVLTIIACCLFVVAFAKARQNARQRPAQFARIQSGLTTRQQAQSVLGRPAAQTLAHDGSVTLHWIRSPSRIQRRRRNLKHTQITCDPQGVVRQVMVG